MAFSGSVIKIGNTDIANYIKQESYKISPAQRQDLDSFVDANGNLNRNVLPHKRSKIEMSTIPMNNTKMCVLMGIIRANYISEAERKVPVTYYRPDTDDYATGNFYVPDPQYPIDRVDRAHNIIYYNAMTLKFIEY